MFSHLEKGFDKSNLVTMSLKPQIFTNSKGENLVDTKAVSQSEQLGEDVTIKSFGHLKEEPSRKSPAYSNLSPTPQPSPSLCRPMRQLPYIMIKDESKASVENDAENQVVPIDATGINKMKEYTAVIKSVLLSDLKLEYKNTCLQSGSSEST